MGSGSFGASKLNGFLRKDLKLAHEVVYRVWSTGKIARSLSLSNSSLRRPGEL